MVADSPLTWIALVFLVYLIQGETLNDYLFHFLIDWLIFCCIVFLGSHAINCYTCSSMNGSNPFCEDPINTHKSTYTEKCMVPKKGHIGIFPANFCIKIVGRNGRCEIQEITNFLSSSSNQTTTGRLVVITQWSKPGQKLKNE